MTTAESEVSRPDWANPPFALTLFPISFYAMSFGHLIKLSLFGESHGPAVGCVLDAPPPGYSLDLEALARHMARRAPGQTGPWSTSRKEADAFEIVSGFYQGKTTGTPLAAVIRNTNTRSGDYANLAVVPRPGHADLTGRIRYKGANDPNGGGHFSGRVTAPLTFAGGVALQILATFGIEIHARIVEIGGVEDRTEISPLQGLPDISSRPFPVLDEAVGTQIVAAIDAARRSLDSLGGVIEVRATGVPAGVGSPFFNRVESRLGAMFFSINAVRGVTFGDGFAASRSRGSLNNDPPTPSPDGSLAHIGRTSNHAGGAEGGISTGLPIIARLAFKPTPSILQEQQSVNLETNEKTPLSVRGRHDPCIVVRAVPVVESAMAFALLDLMLEHGCFPMTPA